MIVGFTGTREGMTMAQERQLSLLLFALKSVVRPDANEFHHGDEPHADRTAAELADQQGYKIVPHPPKSFAAKDLLDRNRDIVAAAEVLIAAPKTDTEQLRSGTWFTIRRMYEAGKPVIHLARGR